MRQTSKNVSPMSNEGRNLYVITHITESLLELLKDKPLNDISISELCSHAQVGRATFYRNFEVKEDVLNVYIHKLFSEWIDTYESNPPKTISQMVRELFLHLEKYRDFYGLLSERGLIYLLKNVLLEIYAPKPEQPAQAAYASAYVAYTLYGWIEVWFQRGMKETPEEMAAMQPCPAAPAGAAIPLGERTCPTNGRATTACFSRW